MSPTKWIGKTNAKGIVSKRGRNGGTYAHQGIALEFASWVSSGFKLYLIKDIQEAEDYDGFGVEDLIASGDRELDKMLKKYHKSVDKIETLITGSFYLERAKEFYSPYNMYIR